MLFRSQPVNQIQEESPILIFFLPGLIDWLLKVNIQVLNIAAFTGLIIGSAANDIIAMNINMQRNETDKGEKGNISIRGCILMVTGTLKKSMPNKESNP